MLYSSRFVWVIQFIQYGLYGSILMVSWFIYGSSFMIYMASINSLYGLFSLVYGLFLMV